MTNQLTGMAPVSITRRRVVAGAAGLGAASLLGLRMAQAQDTTATPGAGTDTDSTVTSETTDATDLRAESYQDFVSKLAANLGVTDTATVDTAIRDALKAIVDDHLAAGEISANSATERKTEIDASVSPLRVGFFGDEGGPRGGHGSGGDRGDGMKPGTDDSTDATDSTDSTTGTPEATGASGLTIS